MQTNEFIQRFRDYTSQFNRSFWVVNTLELFERGAYYGTMAILAVHFHDNLGYSASLYGILAMVLMFLLYFVPLIAAAMAEKIGYKTTLIGAFCMMIVGSICLGLFEGVGLVIFAILMLGIGAGAFKPMVSATIAHVTPVEHRNAGYSIYYWLINLGAFLVPLSIGLTKTFDIMDPEKDSYIVFFISSILISINLIITLLKFEDPVKANPDKDIVAAIKTLWTVLHDRKFVILLMIYSGFWFMFAMCHSYLPLYMKRFHIMPDWFSVFFLAIINPGTIILIGFELSKVVEKYDSLQLMMCGIALFVVGILMLGMTTVPALFFLGIVIFSFGEFITHPNFIAYVSRIAPKDRVAIYMGYIFIPTGVGYGIGSAVGGVLFDIVAQDMERPKLFWGTVASVGLMTLIGFIFYDYYILKADKRAGAIKTAAPVTDDGEVLETEDVVEEERKPSPIPFTLPAFLANSKAGNFMPAIIAFMLIFVVVGVAYSGGTNTYYEEEEDDDYFYYLSEDWEDWIEHEDYTNEDEETSWTEELDENGVGLMKFELHWQDEADAPDTLLYTYDNQPDRFNFSVETPWGITYYSETEENAHDPDGNGGEHTITLEIEISDDTHVKKGGTTKAETEGDFIITVRCIEAGDQEEQNDPLNDNDQDDDGNDWDFKASYMEIKRAKRGTDPSKL